MKTYPEFCVLHVPHNATNIPSDLRHQFCLTEEELTCELVNMTDWHTRDLFAPPDEVVTLVEAKVSRLVDQSVDRPEICLGTDSFHTPESLLEEFLKAFQEAGFRTKVNAPFSGAIVPLRFYQTENAVQSIMVEVSRSLYLDESTGLKRKDFDSVAAKIRSCCRRAIAECFRNNHEFFILHFSDLRY